MTKNSLKKKFAAAFACAVAAVAIICTLSVYTYEVLIGRLADYSSSLSELNEFRFQFSEFNSTVEEYLETGSTDSREKYGNLRNELTELCVSISEKYSGSDDRVQSSLAESIDSNLKKYIQQTDALVDSADLASSSEQYINKYSKSSGYIESYIEKLISSRYKNSAETLEDTNTRILVFKFILAFVLFLFAVLLAGMAFMLFRYVINPIERLSRQSRQIANFNFDIAVDVPETGDEIQELSANFSEMKDRLKEFFETNNKNIQVLDDMLIQFEGNQELKNYINNQREINDSIFRQANVDHVAGIMNGKAFMHCVRDDIAIEDNENICAVSVVEIINYSEISNSVYEGVDELIKSTVKKLNYIVGKSGYIARWEKGLFTIFVPDIRKCGDIEKLSLDLKNAVDDEFVYKKVRQHVSARVNTLVSHAPKSEKMLVNFVLSGIENVKPGEYKISHNNVL